MIGPERTDHLANGRQPKMSCFHFRYRHLGRQPRATICLTGVSPYKHCVVRSPHSRGVQVSHPKQNHLCRLPSWVPQKQRKEKKTVPWLPISRSEGRLIQRRCQPTPIFERGKEDSVESLYPTCVEYSTHTMYQPSAPHCQRRLYPYQKSIMGVICSDAVGQG